MNFWNFECPPFLAEAAKEDPIGFNCEKQILNITEVSFVEQVRCYNTTEQVCSMVSTKGQLILKANFLVLI